MADGATEAPTIEHAGDARVLAVDMGRRVLVVANLRLSEATPASTWATTALARTLESWDGPGSVVVAGNLFDFTDTENPSAAAERALSAHPRLTEALAAFAGMEQRTVIGVPGNRDGALSEPAVQKVVEKRLGMQTAPRVELNLSTAAGNRQVRIDACAGVAPQQAPDPTVAVASLNPDAGKPWQHGLDRLADPTRVQRFVTSRLLYRRFARLVWWLLIPFAVAVALRIPLSSNWLYHLVQAHPTPARALTRARDAGWGPRLAVAATVSAAEIVVLVLVLGLLSRKAWRALGGEVLPGIFDEPGDDHGATVNDAGRDAGRELVDSGWSGVVMGSTLQAELTDLRGAFFASTGVVGEVVEEHPGRLGLPPVFLEHRQVSWVELETGADLHARLLLARNDVKPSTLLERLAGRYRRMHDSVPAVVAAHPSGPSWPPAPDLGLMRRRSRRVRRWVSLAIALTGLMDLLSALTPPLRARLHHVLQFLPLAASQTAGALVAIAGIGLLALARGVRRGQQRAWRIATVLLAVTLVLHVVRGGDLEESLLSGLVLLLLMVFRTEFQAPADLPATRSAIGALVFGGLGVTVLATVAVELTLRFDRHPHHFIALWRAGYAVVSRLVGVDNVQLPDRLGDFLDPTLIALGIVLALATVLLATRPVVDRRLTHGRAAELRARDVVRRHGQGTLDYFALRNDKKWFFHRDSFVAYAIYGGV